MRWCDRLPTGSQFVLSWQPDKTIEVNMTEAPWYMQCCKWWLDTANDIKTDWTFSVSSSSLDDLNVLSPLRDRTHATMGRFRGVLESELYTDVIDGVWILRPVIIPFDFVIVELSRSKSMWSCTWMTLARKDPILTFQRVGCDVTPSYPISSHQTLDLSTYWNLDRVYIGLSPDPVSIVAKCSHSVRHMIANSVNIFSPDDLPFLRCSHG